MIYYLNENFPNVNFILKKFLLLNKEVLYNILKLKFYNYLISESNIERATDFYLSEFRSIIKEVKARNFERKNAYFINILKNPHILRNKNIFEDLYERFIFKLNKDITNFLFNPVMPNQSAATMFYDNSSNSNSNLFMENNGDNTEAQPQAQAQIDVDSQSSQSQMDTSNNHNNANNQDDNCGREEEIKDLSKLSTMEEYSDFEEDVEAYTPCNVNSGDNAIASTTNEFSVTQSPAVSGTSSAFKSKFLINLDFMNFIETGQIQPQPEIQPQQQVNNVNATFSTKPVVNANNITPNYSNSTTSLPDLNANIYSLHKPYVPMPKKNETLKEKYPLLKQFKPKYTKRENIDKKILRKFKAFLLAQFKSKELNLTNSDKNFWIMFINGNIFPPLKYTDNNTGEFVDFKSLNSNFINWLFSKRGAEQFYNNFITKEGENVINFLMGEYLVHKTEDIKQLEFYVKNLYKVFTVKKTMAPKPIEDPFMIEDENIKMRFRERSREFCDDEYNSIRYFGGYESQDDDEE
jgi:hypothetical protein